MSSGLWYRTLVYLGLKEEPEEGYDELPERGSHYDEGIRHEHGYEVPFEESDPGRSAVRAVGDELGDTNVRPLRSAEQPHVRPFGGSVRLAVVEVVEFEDVEAVGSRYRNAQPVLFDLRAADAAVARRVVDFVSGLTYALRGGMQKVGPRAFLLLPEGVDLPAEEEDRMTSLGYRPPSGSGA